jgi:hypothetical protein
LVVTSEQILFIFMFQIDFVIYTMVH